MDHCYWPARWDAPIPPTFARVYLGEEGCGHHLASPAFLARVLGLLESGRAVTVVSPYLTPQRERDLAALLEKLPRPTEVVAGDLGAFALIASGGHTPIAGRLMMRQNTDPAIAGFARPQPARTVLTQDGPRALRHAPPPQDLQVHFKTPALFSPAALAVLAGLAGHAPRLELDCPPHGLPAAAPTGAAISLHAEECLLAALPCQSCAGCPDGPAPAGATRTGTPVMRRKNLLLYPVAAQTPPAWVSRLIWRNPVPVSPVS